MEAAPMRENHVAAAARLHAEALPQTLNSKLGVGLLEFLYRCVASDPDGRACVVEEEGRLAGLATATLDFERTRARIAQRMPWSLKLVCGAKIIAGIGGVSEYVSHARLERFFKTVRRPYPTILTLAVAPAWRGRGVGAALLSELESFYRRSGCSCYFVDTLRDNAAARGFYEAAGFALISDFLRHRVYRKDIG